MPEYKGYAYAAAILPLSGWIFRVGNWIIYPTSCQQVTNEKRPAVLHRLLFGSAVGVDHMRLLQRGVVFCIEHGD
jgi:hypothetical protein